MTSPWALWPLSQRWRRRSKARRLVESTWSRCSQDQAAGPVNMAASSLHEAREHVGGVAGGGGGIGQVADIDDHRAGEVALAEDVEEFGQGGLAFAEHGGAEALAAADGVGGGELA